MKKNSLGTLSLLIALVGWILLHLAGFFVQERTLPYNLLNALFSSALVGAIADWFAVTALFKKPLGLPLPHVDVLRRRKDDVARAVPRFLADLLTPQELAPELRRLDYFHALEAGVAHLRRNADLPMTIASLLMWSIQTGWSAKFCATGAGILSKTLQKNKIQLTGYLTNLIKKNAGWQGLFVGPSTVEKFLNVAIEELKVLQNDPRHPFCSFLIQSVETYAQELQNPDSLSRLKLEQALHTLERDPVVQNSFLHLLESALRLEESKEALGELETIERKKLINQGLGDLLVEVIERTQALPRAADTLGDFLAGMDADQFVAQVERNVWNDLQYIRVNGALVGGIVGLFLALFSFVTGAKVG
ncbi:MAG: DUF445 family protein [Spirochaetales bacterium]|nr:DUF445 family protein [Spirochaetales bacterium]